MFVRERIIPDKNQLLLFDIRGEQEYNDMRVFKSELLNAENLVKDDEKLN
jgi:hypothetical protein